MNEHVKAAIDLYAAHGADFNANLAHCLAFGEVQSNAEFFCMGWPDHGGFWVQCLTGNMRACLRLNKGRYARIIFNREFRKDTRIRSLRHSDLARHGKRIHTTTAAE